MLLSAVLPYVFILILGAGLLALTLLFSTIYKVLPIVRVSPRRAIVGGLVAAILWEATRSAPQPQDA